MNQPSEPNAQQAADAATAYHEAGHAVAALALDRPVIKVSIRPDRDRLGICAFGKPVVRPSEDWLEREMLIALAGMAAEARYTGIHDRESATRDLRYVHRLALQRAGNERQAERLQRRLLAKVENLLDRAANRTAIERLAEELLRAGEISGRQARHLYEECLRQQEQ